MSNSTSNNDSKKCSVCGKEDATCCSRGKCECQKSDWKRHKTECFPPNSTCTRCLQAIDNANPGMCYISHPEHLLQNCGSAFGGGKRKFRFGCNACQQSFIKSKKYPDDGSGWTFAPPNALWCYQGPHTVKPLKEDDQRRISNDIAVIQVADGDTTQDIQQALVQQMDSTTVRILVFKSADGTYYDGVNPTLDCIMPQLEEIQLLDVAFAKIVLNATTTPKLKKIEMQNLPEDCSIQIECPTLEDMDVRFYNSYDWEECWVYQTLKIATKLKKFRSYKLHVDDLIFASTELKEIHIHRSDCLDEITIWAPQLEYLRLQGCYNLESLRLPQTCPYLTYSGPKSQFLVEAVNSNLSRQVVQLLENHPRVHWVK